MSTHVREVLRKRGLGYVLRRAWIKVAGWPIRKAACLRRRWFWKGRAFTFRGRSIEYLYHMHNTTWRNERSVEVPIMWSWVRDVSPESVLEIGNVLSNYYPVRHDVLDKYERAPRVINEDVADFSTSKKYALIVSVSTLEHVGWDEDPKDPEKILRSIANLKRGLAPGGKILVTMPFGENPELDRHLREGRIRFREETCLRRASDQNDWVEASREEACSMAYDRKTPRANAIIVGELA